MGQPRLVGGVANQVLTDFFFIKREQGFQRHGAPARIFFAQHVAEDFLLVAITAKDHASVVAALGDELVDEGGGVGCGCNDGAGGLVNFGAPAGNFCLGKGLSGHVITSLSLY
nr:hypothetical protein [Lacticaseibacillus nasuensis]